MRVPLSWLKKYINVDLSTVEISKILTMAGLEVEAVETVPLGFKGVVVARVLKTEKHPNADKLTIATVTDGREEMQVVCGAPNCRAGIKAALARVGATLVDSHNTPFKIKKTKIRGIESFGMLCAEEELLVADSSDGIVELPNHLDEGSDLTDYYAETVFEITLTPNLGHCANIIGVARELYIATEAPLTPPQITIASETGIPTHDSISVAVNDKEGCPRYACRLVRNVAVAPSPRWLQNLLNASGIRPINNIVDITNFVLLELGHPIHAFDYNRIDGGELIIRKAKEREPFVTLDGKERLLHSDDLLICDRTQPIAIGGVMGGVNSEVRETTRDVLIEAAYFTPSRIRRTSKRQALLTEASRRFERGSDPNQVTAALNRAAMLMEELAGGEVAPDIVDVKEGDFSSQTIPCRLSRIQSLLGITFSIGEVEAIFRKLNLACRWDGNGTFAVTIPTYRVDISEEVDLIEEVARVYGYDNFHKQVTRAHVSGAHHSSVFLFEREVRQRLLSEGLQEFLNCDLIGPTILDTIQSGDDDDMIRVLNPTSIEQSLLRTSLLPGLLQVVKYNHDRQTPDISGFEIGKVHFKEGDKYREEEVAAIIMIGTHTPHFWGGKPHEVDFYDIKGIVTNLLNELGISGYRFISHANSTLHPGRQAAVYVGNNEIGSLGEVHPAILRRLDFPNKVYFAEFNLNDLYQLRARDVQMEALSIYPGSERDWTLTLHADIAVADIFDAVATVESTLLVDCFVLDLYTSDKLGLDIKNITFRFIYREQTHTIEQKTVDQEHARITDKVRHILSSKQVLAQ